jgi:hypothetical protein
VEAIVKTLIDKLPVATVIAYVGAAIALIGYLNGDLTVFEALAAVGITNFGAGKLGQARNEAGRGLRKP